MTHYFFHIRDDANTIKDEEGDDFADFEQARVRAVTAIRELAAARIKSGDKIGDAHMDLCDEAGDLLLSLSSRRWWRST
ncbi:hypothetical protein ABID21_000076 [Pseudorhizobium tarimense]|uniref:DUF6894 domain-containing protein n=1 Tax=Pseudorhizobium tarimense TaxID=1079109 RepID=A0ABV2H0E2_9HYPH|nr:hypothetical protein [Pseudorhizobium tarimense]MCJ8517330.1 hypothetical protein [Pseudorhizobium tarimense]